MPWRFGWPPWESKRVVNDRLRALEAVERATLDLAETRLRIQRADRVNSSIQQAGARNHFSESMEALFTSAWPVGQHGETRRGG